MQVEKTPLKDCFLIHDTVFKDERGYFFESFNKKQFAELTGENIDFVQDNQSCSSRGVLRGLHFQKGEAAQAKLVRVLTGAVYDVAVDLRTDSPTFGRSFGIELNEVTNMQIFIPRGFAHGFVVLSESCTFFYKCDNYYYKDQETGIMYNDLDLNINWPIPETELIISERDKNHPGFKAAMQLM